MISLVHCILLSRDVKRDDAIVTFRVFSLEWSWLIQDVVVVFDQKRYHAYRVNIANYSGFREIVIFIAKTCWSNIIAKQ